MLKLLESVSGMSSVNPLILILYPTQKASHPIVIFSFSFCTELLPANTCTLATTGKKVVEFVVARCIRTVLFCFFIPLSLRFAYCLTKCSKADFSNCAFENPEEVWEAPFFWRGWRWVGGGGGNLRWHNLFHVKLWNSKRPLVTH